MSKTTVQNVVFRNTTPHALYELYMNAKKHSLVTGAAARISAREGAVYSAHDGYISGKNLRLVKDKQIVQTWRASGWNDSDTDSVFILNFEPKGKDVVLQVVHANLPDKHAASINKGWHDYYWGPWKNYIAGKAAKPPKM
jgi:activator of HSP90 ATPase